jgi:hypothetical protein
MWVGSGPWPLCQANDRFKTKSGAVILVRRSTKIFGHY